MRDFENMDNFVTLNPSILGATELSFHLNSLVEEVTDRSRLSCIYQTYYGHEQRRCSLRSIRWMTGNGDNFLPCLGFYL